MAAANQQQRLQMGQQSLQSQSQNPQQRSVKRNSTSPGEDVRVQIPFYTPQLPYVLSPYSTPNYHEMSRLRPRISVSERLLQEESILNQ